MLRWPENAKRALAYLFRPLQDVDIYVEDSGDEAFYSELFKRVVPPTVRVARVFSAGGRHAVLKLAEKHDFTRRRACFIIDGDFAWVRGEISPEQRGVIRLNAYCIENLLICERAAVQIIVEEEAITQEEAERRLDFASWLEEIREHLVDLFVCFAVLNLVNPTEPTVNRGVGSILGAARKGAPPVLNARKVTRLLAEIEGKIVSAVGPERAKQLRAMVSGRVTELESPVDAVSGKDFLLPLLEFRLWRCMESKTRRRSLRFRLARHCDINRFSEFCATLVRVVEC